MFKEDVVSSDADYLVGVNKADEQLWDRPYGKNMCKVLQKHSRGSRISAEYGAKKGFLDIVFILFNISQHSQALFGIMLSYYSNAYILT